MEKNFLLYLIYVALLDIRERSYDHNDKVIFGFCDLLHNVPQILMLDESGKRAYDDVLKRIESKGMNNWLEERKKEFYDQYPEFRE